MDVLLASVFFTLYIRLVGLTTKIYRYSEAALPEGGFIYVFWHSRLAFLAYSHRGKAIRVLLSTSRDGEIIWRVLKSLGFRAVRGTASDPASARSAAVGMLRALKNRNILAVTPDGPRGPALKVKKGVPYVAVKSGCPLVPVSWAVKRKKIIKSWDRLVLPLPFNRAAVVTGKPYYVEKGADLKREARKISGLINETGKKARELL